MEVVRHRDKWTVKINTDTRKVELYFCNKSMATIIIGDNTYSDISKDMASLEKYAKHMLDRCLNGDFSI